MHRHFLVHRSYQVTLLTIIHRTWPVEIVKGSSYAAIQDDEGNQMNATC